MNTADALRALLGGKLVRRVEDPKYHFRLSHDDSNWLLEYSSPSTKTYSKTDLHFFSRCNTEWELYELPQVSAPTPPTQVGLEEILKRTDDLKSELKALKCDLESGLKGLHYRLEDGHAVRLAMLERIITEVEKPQHPNTLLVLAEDMIRDAYRSLLRPLEGP